MDTRPACVPCGVRMRCEKNGTRIRYTDHQIQNGDLYRCPSCGHRIVMGFGQTPFDFNAGDGDFLYPDNPPKTLEEFRDRVYAQNLDLPLGVQESLRSAR